MVDSAGHSHDNLSVWRHFWHPVCTLDELRQAQPGGLGPLPVTLLGIKLVVAQLTDSIAVFQDRCAHRSASLSLGAVEANGLRCAYHGWLYGEDGHCLEIPSCPNSAIPSKAKIAAYESEVRYDLVWVRLSAGCESKIPDCPAWNDPTMKVVPGEPYTWPTAAGRRLENFVDLAHFPFVHDGTLGRRAQTETAIPLIDRIDGELRFEFEPPENLDLADIALMAQTRYRIFLPFGVNLEFLFEQGQKRSHLWMCASPIDYGICRSFWFTCRDHQKDQLDKPHLDFQDVVLAEDLPVIASQDPAEIPPQGVEVSVKSDQVSMHYRRCLYEIIGASGADEINKALAKRVPDPARDNTHSRTATT